MQINSHVFSITDQEVPVVYVVFTKEKDDTVLSIDEGINEYLVNSCGITSYVYMKQASDGDEYVYTFQIGTMQEERIRDMFRPICLN